MSVSESICPACGKPVAGGGVYSAGYGAASLYHEACARAILANVKTDPGSATADRIRRACDAVRDMLLAKNASYGDSALKPTGIFAKGSAEDLIRVRIDDKLSRIKNAPDAFGEDVIGDLIGYLILLKLALEDAQEAKKP